MFKKRGKPFDGFANLYRQHRLFICQRMIRSLVSGLLIETS